MARFEHRAVDPAPPGLSFLRAAAPGFHTHLHSSLAVRVMPRLRVALGPSPVHGDTERGYAVPAPAVVLRGAVAERAQRLVERVLAQGVRLEARTPAAAAIAGSSPADAIPVGAVPDWGTPVPSVVVNQRERADAEPPAGDPGTGPTAPAAARPAVLAGAGAPRAPANVAGGPVPLDLAKVADQVLATIDRRIVAERERLGRP
jgi:hypothetical protein